MNTPMLDLARDPRWGRMEETYGEDVYLVAQMGLAAINGLQGNGDPVHPEGIVAAFKHFAGYGQCDGVPAHGDEPLQNDLLRKECVGGKRAVVADYRDIHRLNIHASCGPVVGGRSIAGSIQGRSFESLFSNSTQGFRDCAYRRFKDADAVVSNRRVMTMVKPCCMIEIRI